MGNYNRVRKGVIKGGRESRSGTEEGDSTRFVDSQ